MSGTPSHRVPAVRTVYWKEMRESFRDWRTLFSVVISPLLLTPLLLALVGYVVQREARKERREVVPVALVGAAGTRQAEDLLRGASRLRVERVSRPEAEEGVRKRRFRAAVLLPEGVDGRLSRQEPVAVQLLVDPGSEASRRAADRLREFFDEQGRSLATTRLRRAGLSPEIVQPFRVSEAPVPGGGSPATLLLSTFLPYIMAIGAILGSVYAANDMVAGEKERGTLEALLVSPASRRDLVLGKFLAVASVSLVSSQLSVVGLLWPFLIRVPGLEWMTGAGLKLGGLSILLLLLVQVPLAVLGAGLLLAVSTYARNQKEAQSYLGPVMLVATVCAMLSMLLRAEPPLTLALVPILNASLALKQALSGSVNPAFVSLAFAASILYAVGIVLLAARLFSRESVLLKA